jgi:hypothetical protein
MPGIFISYSKSVWEFRGGYFRFFWSPFRGEKYFVVGEDVEVEPVMGGEYIRDIYTRPYNPTEDKLLVGLRSGDELRKLNARAQIEDVRRMHKGWRMQDVKLKSLVTGAFWEW